MSNVTAFIGGGNMAGSLIGGLLQAGVDASAIRVAEPLAARATELRQRFGVTVASDAGEIVDGADLVVLAVKPQQALSAMQGLRLADATVVLSIVAGLRLPRLQQSLGTALYYVRSMPNTPALYGCGISGLYAPPQTPEAARQRAEQVLRAGGTTCWVDSEAALDAVTAISGSGPAYVFLLAEMMADAGVALGLPRDTAQQLANHTVGGAARMIEHAPFSPEQLRAQVTSKGGTTAAAIEHLENSRFRSIFLEALRAAADRSRELGDQLATS